VCTTRTGVCSRYRPGGGCGEERLGGEEAVDGGCELRGGEGQVVRRREARSAGEGDRGGRYWSASASVVLDVIKLRLIKFRWGTYCRIRGSRRSRRGNPGGHGGRRWGERIWGLRAGGERWVCGLLVASLGK